MNYLYPCVRLAVHIEKFALDFHIRLNPVSGAVFRTWLDIQGRLDPKLGLSNPNPDQAKQSLKREF